MSLFRNKDHPEDRRDDVMTMAERCTCEKPMLEWLDRLEAEERRMDAELAAMRVDVDAMFDQVKEFEMIESGIGKRLRRIRAMGNDAIKKALETTERARKVLETVQKIKPT